jgi:hypothetical protein
VLTHLPYNLRTCIERYTAYEPNHLFAEQLKSSLDAGVESGKALPSLRSAATIHEYGFDPGMSAGQGECDAKDDVPTFDIVLFCHSLYGLKPQHKYIERAINMLAPECEDSLVIVFHRDGVLELGRLVCHHAMIHPQEMVSVEDSDVSLDQFAHFIAGCAVPGETENEEIHAALRQICRKFGVGSSTEPSQLCLSSPDALFTFGRLALALPKLLDSVLAAPVQYMVKNREARARRLAAIVRPTTIMHIQNCVRWALKHRLSLTVIGGGHGGQCLWPNVVAIDMSAFNDINIMRSHTSIFPNLVVVGAGCTSGDIIHKIMAVGLTVPLGSRPSVGAGLWLQGGLGHLARIHGLSCDSIVGAVVVSASSGDIWQLGHVPADYLPKGAPKPANEADLLWAIKGAGTNFGIVTRVVFKPCKTPRYLIRSWILSMHNNQDAEHEVQKLDHEIVNTLPTDCSADAYLFWENDKLQLEIAFCEVFDAESTQEGTDIHCLIDQCKAWARLQNTGCRQRWPL